MPPFIRYFWFLAALVLLINVPIWRRRLAEVVARDGLTQEEADRFIRWAAFWIGVPSLILGVIGLLAGWPSPLCAGVLSFADLPRAAVSSVALIVWIALLWWVWRGGGAEFLARVGPALSKRPSNDKNYSPAQVRMALTALVLLSSVGSAVMSRWMPMPPEVVCPVASELPRR
jgi:hypothetical protein